jgi:hypothetical protein
MNRHANVLNAAPGHVIEDNNQLIRLWKWERSKKHRVYNAEDCGVCANAQGKREYRDYGETGSGDQ